MKPERITAVGGSGVIGVFGGLIGLGGAEFRIPLLVGVFRQTRQGVTASARAHHLPRQPRSA